MPQGVRVRVSPSAPSFLHPQLMPSCPLCFSTKNSTFYTEQRKPLAGRVFWRCSNCDLIFVAANQQLSAEEEKSVYLLHENHPDDPGYRRFLQSLVQPLLPLLQAQEKARGRPLSGLDFGCGPGPTLSLMLASEGYECSLYDPYFVNDPECLQASYDFITSSEVFEHLARPGEVLSRLISCLKPGGLLAIMTQRPQDLAAFKNWHYLRDPTHISFYSEACFAWIAQEFKLQQLFLGKSTIVLKKESA